MKTKISRIGKKSLSVIIALMMIVSTMLVGMVSVSADTFSPGTKIYLDVTNKTDWTESGYIYMYMYGTGDESWAKMTKVTGETYIYEGTVPDGTDDSNIIFLRNKTDVKSWNQDRQTIDIKTYDGVKNMYVLSATDSAQKFGETYKQQGSWDTYSGSSTTEYTVTKGPETNGTFSVSPTSAAEGATVTVTTSPSSGYEVDTVTYTPEGGSATTVSGSDNTYTFTMPAAKVTVNVSFKATPTPTTTYYLTGRFGIKKDGNMTYLKNKENDWEDGNTSNIKFTQVPDSTLYKLETGQTIKELAAHNNIWYFQISDGTTKYRPASGDVNGDISLTILNNNTEFDTGTEKGSFYFTGVDETGNVTLYFDSSSNKFHFEVEGGTDTPGTLESGTTVYVRSSTEIKAAKLSTTLDSVAQETGVAMAAAKIKDFNAKYYYSYTLTKDADNVTFTVTLKDAAEAITKSAACKAGMNVYDVDTGTWSAYDIDKANAYTSGLWVDVQPTVTNTTLALIKWSNQYGSSGTLSQTDGYDTYHLYLPSGVTLSTLPIYSKFSSLKIDETTVENGKPYSSLTAGKTYTVVGDGTTYKLKVYQSDAASIYTSTPSGDLPTTTDSNLLSRYKAEGYKPSFKNGSFMTVSENGSIKNSLTTLVQVKGRGNSSWESSCEHFGKYAYNIKLSSKIDPLGMGATKAKSFCMLANNMDEAQLRNLMTYQMGLDANIPFTPHFKAVDWYNNGTYLGSYLITEKVDVGSSKLVKGTTVEDYHTYDPDTVDSSSEQTYNITTPTGNNFTGKYVYVPTGSYNPKTGESSDAYKNKSYLLEFDLKTRAQAERSWFVSPKGQYIAIKSYEDLSQEEMLFIIEKWCEAEDAVYDGNYEKANSLMDLDSFAQVYLVQELSKNLDSCATSYYVYYDGTQASPKWQATPLWDYDWAYGIYKNQCKAYDSSKEYATNDLYKKDGWFAKYKYLTQDGDKAIDNKPYSFQAQLCTMPDFWNGNVKGVWNGGFYQSAVSAFGKYNSSSDITSGKINTVYDSIDDSIAMNEARYGFVANCPITEWGSAGENKTPNAAYSYFKNWTAERINWMATTGGLGTPVALTNVTLNAPTEVTVGDNITLTATVTPSTTTGVTYTFYQGTEVLASNSESNTYTVTPSTTGTYTFRVVATDGLTEVESDVISVTVKPLSITGVTLESSKSTVKPGVEFTLTATATPGGLSDVTYKFYRSTDNSETTKDDDVEIETVTNNVATVTASTTAGTYYYYVVATHTTGEKTSTPVSVKITNEGDVIENVKIRFKGTTLSSLIPYMSVDGGTATVMTRSTANPIGTHLSGAYRFVWFEATIDTVTVGKSKTLTFTTNNSKESTMNASITLNFTTLDDNVIYLAVDNMMSGTTAVDITDNQTAKTSFGSAMNMIKQSSAVDPVATTLLSTMLKITSASGKVTTKRYYLGDLDSDNKIGIKDATEIQKSIAGSSELGAEYQSLGDFNADGVVDIKDATAIQKYIAGI